MLKHIRAKLINELLSFVAFEANQFVNFCVSKANKLTAAAFYGAQTQELIDKCFNLQLA